VFFATGGMVGASATALSNRGGAFADAQTPVPYTTASDDTSPPQADASGLCRWVISVQMP